MRVSISEAARILGVSITTLRRWDREGKLVAYRTPAGHRRYDADQLRQMAASHEPESSSAGLTLAYARVSTSEQRDALERQAVLLSGVCERYGWEYDVIRDIGSGLDARHSGLRELIKQICSGDVQRLAIARRDRLLAIGAELIFLLCEMFHVQIVILNPPEETFAPVGEFDRDVREIMAIFSERLSACRKQNAEQLKRTLQQIAEDL